MSPHGKFVTAVAYSPDGRCPIPPLSLSLLFITLTPRVIHKVSLSRRQASTPPPTTVAYTVVGAYTDKPSIQRAEFVLEWYLIGRQVRDGRGLISRRDLPTPTTLISQKVFLKLFCKKSTPPQIRQLIRRHLASGAIDGAVHLLNAESGAYLLLLLYYSPA